MAQTRQIRDAKIREGVVVIVRFSADFNSEYTESRVESSLNAEHSCMVQEWTYEFCNYMGEPLV